MRDSLKTSVPGSIWGSELLVAVALTGLAGCAVRGCGDAGRQPIVDVQIVNVAAQRREAAADVPDEAIQPTILQMMESWPDFAFRRAVVDEVGWQLTVRLAQLTERTADPAMATVKARSAGIALELVPLGAVEGESARYTAELLIAREEPGATPIIGLVQEALRKAGQRLMRIRSVERGSDDEVVSAIGDADEPIRIVGIQTAARRKVRAAIPALIERLKDEKEAGTVIVSTVGALAAMQATEATEAIIDTARRQDRSYIVPLLYALAQLGGRKAQAYLFTVQSGHPDPVVKDAAAKALRELEERSETP